MLHSESHCIWQRCGLESIPVAVLMTCDLNPYTRNFLSQLLVIESSPAGTLSGQKYNNLNILLHVLQILV